MASSTYSYPLLKLFYCLVLVWAAALSHGLDVSKEFSGFGRVVAGYLDESDAAYYSYSDNLTAKPNSLLGLQGTINTGDKLRLTALGLVSHDDDWEADMEWLYLGYRPIANLDIKLGRMHTPFFKISDSLDVGYAYHWVLPPQEVYRDTMVRYFEGGSIQYGMEWQDLFVNAELYSGSFKDEVTISNTEVDLTLESLQGYILKLKWQGFGVRASFHTADVKMGLEEISELRYSLLMAGFDQSAASVDTEGKTDFYQFGFDYHGLDYFAWMEWTKINPSQQLFAESKGYYVGIGRYINTFTLALTYSKLKDEKPKAVEDEIPLGLSPDLDILNANYQGLFSTWPRSEVTSWALTTRWDYNANIAIKGEYKRIEESSPYTTTFESSNVKSSYDSNLFLMSLEWVF